MPMSALGHTRRAMPANAHITLRGGSGRPETGRRTKIPGPRGGWVGLRT